MGSTEDLWVWMNGIKAMYENATMEVLLKTQPFQQIAVKVYG